MVTKTLVVAVTQHNISEVSWTMYICMASKQIQDLQTLHFQH